jgi:uncharacterized membrane protein (DUF2068 family)
MTGMRELKLLDRTQPQTLVIGSIWLYITAAFGLLSLLAGYLTAEILIVSLVLPIAGAYGVANARKWGYYAAVAATGIPVLLDAVAIATGGISSVLGVFGLLNVILVVVAFVLFVHPMSRQYVRAWFH